MQSAMRWVLAAAFGVLTACGRGGGGPTSDAFASGGAYDGEGGDEGSSGGEGGNGEENGRVCEVCKATGGGVFFVDGQRLTFGLNAIPDANPGPGFGGEGISAKGHIEVQLHQTANVFGTVDTLLFCEELDGDTSATFSGELRDGGRFVVTVTDAGEPGRADTVSIVGDGASAFELEQGGNLQVRGLDRCEAPCPETMCWDVETWMCVPCAPPSCPAGTTWSPTTLMCECPAGTIWAPQTETCEAPPDEPPPPPDDPFIPL
jgi:hypothetical protein